MNLKKLLLGTFLLSLTSLSSMAGTVHLPNDFTVKFAETKSISLGEKVFLKNIIVQAEGIRKDSVIEVMVNGDVKGTIYAPGNDPSYVVTIAEETSSIEFRHREGASMRVLDVLGKTIEKIDVPTIFDLQSPQGVDQLARTTIKLVNILAPYSTIDEYEEYLLPLKKKAGNVFVMSNAHGALSLKTRLAMRDMAASIMSASDYLDHLMEQEGLFEYAVEVLIVKETIIDLLY